VAANEFGIRSMLDGAEMPAKKASFLIAHE
jgi:hypothetical protein